MVVPARAGSLRVCSIFRCRRRTIFTVAVGAFATIGLQKSNFGLLRVRTSTFTPSAAFSIIRSQSTLSGLFASSTTPFMASLNPPQATPKWTHVPDDVLALTKAAIDTHRNALDQIATLSPEDSNFSSVRHRVIRSRRFISCSSDFLQVFVSDRPDLVQDCKS